MRYKTVTPRKLPPRNLDWERLNPLLIRAHREIGKLDALLLSIKSPLKILSILKTREAISSLLSQHIDASIHDILAFQLEKEADRPVNSALEALYDYLQAIDYTIKKKGSPFTLAVLKKIHSLVKEHTYVQKKDLGRFRDRQNWIGPKDCAIEEAYFFPPRHTRILRDMQAWSRYFHRKDKDPLIQISLLFAQLLVIHPFMDGNGRVGRILIPFLAYKKGLLSSPYLYLSAYFEKNRVMYFQKLYQISASDDWEGWIIFFLKGCIQQAQLLQIQVSSLMKAHQKVVALLEKQLSATKAAKTADYLFTHRAVREMECKTGCALSKMQCRKIWRLLKKEKVLIPYRKDPSVHVVSWLLK